MIYFVYKVSYATKFGTARAYVGYTGQMEVRRAFHKTKPPTWMKCRAPSCEPKWAVLEKDVPSKHLAWALEAFHASRAIAADPHAVRGGPWLRPTLPEGEEQKIRAIAKMPLAAMLKYGESRQSELLFKHLRGLSFGPADDAPSGAAIARGVFVIKPRSRRSGAKGSKARARRIREGTLVAGSAEHGRSKRGRRPAERRRAETARRPLRCRVMKAA